MASNHQVAERKQPEVRTVDDRVPRENEPQDRQWQHATRDSNKAFILLEAKYARADEHSNNGNQLMSGCVLTERTTLQFAKRRTDKRLGSAAFAAPHTFKAAFCRQGATTCQVARQVCLHQRHCCASGVRNTRMHFGQRLTLIVPTSYMLNNRRRTAI